MGLLVNNTIKLSYKTHNFGSTSSLKSNFVTKGFQSLTTLHKESHNIAVVKNLMQILYLTLLFSRSSEKPICT